MGNILPNRLFGRRKLADTERSKTNGEVKESRRSVSSIFHKSLFIKSKTDQKKSSQFSETGSRISATETSTMDGATDINKAEEMQSNLKHSQEIGNKKETQIVNIPSSPNTEASFNCFNKTETTTIPEESFEIPTEQLTENNNVINEVLVTEDLEIQEKDNENLCQNDVNEFLADLPENKFENADPTPNNSPTEEVPSYYADIFAPEQREELQKKLREINLISDRILNTINEESE